MKRVILVLFLLFLGAGNTYSQGNVYTCPSYGTVNGMGTSGNNIVANLPLLLPDGSAVAPALGFSSSTIGLYQPAAGQLGFANSGQRIALLYGGAVTPNLWLSGDGAAFTMGAAQDLFLIRDAAHTLAMRSSTNPQTFNIYQSYTDGSNYSRVTIDAGVSSAGYVSIKGIGAGTGANAINNMQLVVGSTSGTFEFKGVGSLYTYMNSTGFNPSANGVYNLGDSTHQYGSLFTSQSIQGSKTKSLTDAGAAVAVANVAIASNSYSGGEFIWGVTSTDATDYRVTEGRIRYAGVNKGGSMTCTGNVVGTDLTASSNANTLVCTWTFVAATASCDIKVTCTDNTAGTQTMAVNLRADSPFTSAITYP